MEEKEIIDLNSIQQVLGTDLNKNQLQTANEILAILNKIGYSIREAKEVLEFCNKASECSFVSEFAIHDRHYINDRCFITIGSK